mgnify:CR=1 FL=1
MKAIVTVIGKDQVGITAAVCSLLAQHSINILDISQTILQEYFTMVMLVDTTACDKSIVEISQLLEDAGSERNLSSRIQREDIFNAMHRISARRIGAQGRQTPERMGRPQGPPKAGPGLPGVGGVVDPAARPIRSVISFRRTAQCSVNTKLCRPSR